MDTQTQAAPSPAVAVAEPEVTEVTLPRSGSEEYATWRMTGELPKKPETQAESSPADAPKEENPAVAAESGPAPKQQEQPRKGKDAEHRIKELLADQKRMRAELEALKSRPAQVEQPRQQQQAPQYTRSKPSVDAKNPDGTPKYGTYEDYVEDLADWKAEQRIAQQMQQLAAQAQQRQVAEGVEQARTRYQDFDSVGLPVANAIVSDPQIPNNLKVRINNSKVLPDLLYTIGGDPQFQARFMLAAKTDPEAARDAIALMERDIQDRLSKPARTESETPAPAKRGPENAPPPPIEIGNRGGQVDETERLLKAAANGDRNATRQLLEAENRRLLARRRGA